MPDKNAKKQLKQADSKRDLLNQLLDEFDKLVTDHASRLTAEIIDTFLKALSVEDGKVLTDAQNMRKTALIDRAFAAFQQTYGQSMITDFITGMENLNAANLKYYRSLSPETSIQPADIRNIINYRLGVNDDGSLRKDGYMQGLLDDVSVRNEIKKFTFQKMISGTGYEDLRSGLKDLIQGTPDKMGKFEQFHRNFAYDTYVQVDRFNGLLYAEKLNLKYFIYQGTRRDASRYFCIHRKGKVFTTDEADLWKDLIGTTTTVDGKRVPAGPIVADAGNYNPLVDLGGFGCVDTIAFISQEAAFSLRPELRTAA